MLKEWDKNFSFEKKKILKSMELGTKDFDTKEKKKKVLQIKSIDSPSFF